MDIDISTQTAPEPARVNWKQVGAFLALTFALTWLLDLALYLKGGLASPAASLVLQLQMLLPAFSALLLGVFFFKNSPLYFRTQQTLARWFVYFYFALTLLFTAAAAASLFRPELTGQLAPLLLIPCVLALVLAVVLRLVGGKDTFASAGMAGGRARIWILYGLGLVAFYGLQTLLNFLFKLGKPVDILSLSPQFAASGLSPQLLTLSTAVNAVLIGPILGLVIAFGEEYGWRGYLQSELIRLGRARGVLLLGVIWGIWHWPVIWMGYNFPGQPVLGSLLMVGFTVVLAFFLAYAVFKSGGVWTAAYLHALNNQALAFFIAMVYAPTNITTSFGIGLPGLALGAVVVLLLLRDPLWKES